MAILAAPTTAGNVGGTGGTSVVSAPTNVPPSALNSGIVSTTGVQQEFNDASNAFNTLTNQGDPYAALLASTVGGLEQNAANTANTAISSATAKTAQNETLGNAQEAATIAGIRASNAATGTSGTITNALVQQATNSFSAKFNALDLGEKTAIANARNAEQAGDTKALQQELSYIQQYRTAKQAAADEAFKEYAFSNLSADQKAQLGLQADVDTGTTTTKKPNIFQQVGNLFTGKPITGISSKALGSGFGAPTGSAGSKSAGSLPAGVTAGSTVNYGGKSYTVNAQGVMTPI